MVDEEMTDDRNDSTSAQSSGYYLQDGLVAHKEDMEQKIQWILRAYEGLPDTVSDIYMSTVRVCLQQLDPQRVLSADELQGLKYVLARMAMDRARHKIRKAHQDKRRMQAVCEHLEEEILRSQEGLQATQAVCLEELLAAVTPDQRKILELKADGLTHRDISKATGMSLNTIGRKLQRVGEVGMKLLARDSNVSS